MDFSAQNVASVGRRIGPVLLVGLVALTLAVSLGLGTSTAVGASARTSASAGQSARVKAACSTSSYVWRHLKSCHRAGPSTTGARPSACPHHRLVTKRGSASRIIRITRPGTVIRCQRITGCLSIQAPRVSVLDVRIACTSGRRGEAANGTAVIKIQDGASARIAHVNINGVRGVHACIWHQGRSMYAKAINCTGVNDGVFSWADRGYSATTGDHFTVRDSYFHNFTTRTANGHIDGYQTEGAAYGVIDHNTFLMTSDARNSTNSAVAIWNDLKSSHDILVRNNLIAGGGFAVYAEDSSPSESRPAGGYSVYRIIFVNNLFSRRLFGCVGYYGVWFPRGAPTDGWRRKGNRVLESRANVDRGNPSYAGRGCV